ncbi:MAG: hypothetical protein SGARI_007823 [Bacillariaceae sp.]
MQQSASKSAGAASNRRSHGTSGADASNASSASSPATQGSFLTKYFMVILFGFACLSLGLNSRFAHIVVEDVSIIESVLQNSQHPVLDDDHTKRADEDRLEELHHKELEKHHAEQEQSESLHHEPDIPPENDGEIVHQIANLKCDAFGGPSEEKAQEMVYWEDIPQDAQYMSPFHRKIRKGDGKLSMTQFLTFEPDHVSSVLTAVHRRPEWKEYI